MNIQPARFSIISFIVYLALVVVSLLFSHLKFFTNPTFSLFQHVDDYILGVLSVFMLGGTIYIGTRKLNNVESQQAKSEQEIHRLQKNVDSFLETITRLNSRLDLSVVLQFICKDLTAAAGFEAATLTLYYPETGVLELEAMYGLPNNFRLIFDPVQFYGGAARMATQSSPVAHSGDFADLTDFPHIELYRKNNCYGMAYMPLRYNQEFYGILTAVSLSEKTSQFSTEQLDFLRAFADSASLAVRSTNLFNDLIRSSKKLDALTSDRPYRKAWSQEQALQYIREQAGKFFDPVIADTFVKMVDNGR